MRHRVLLQTDPTHLKTGLSENAKTLLKYLYKTGKYDLAHYWQQGTHVTDGRLNDTPWKSFGCIPANPQLIHELNSNPLHARDASYGSYNIDNVVKEWKPTIWIGSNDIWAFPHHAYMDKPWYKAINAVPHITIDSIPVLPQAFEQAEKSKYYVTWAKFAAKEMKRFGPKYAHVSSIYGAMDITKFSPIQPQERLELRKRFGLSPHSVIFLFVGRNQLRKSFPNALEAFAQFKRENPQADAKILFHTSYSEKGQGWDIPRLAAYYGVNQLDILASYVCKTCGQWLVRPYSGEDLDCPYCKAQKSMVTASIVHGVPDDEMRYVYGLCDAGLSAFTSGGQEYHSVQTLLCGKPLACTNYSCGEDFCEQSFVTTLGWAPYHEPGNNFIKSATSVQDIKKFFIRIWRSQPKDLAAIGDVGRSWAVRTFGIETIGAQWEKLFDSMSHPDWSSINMKPTPKNGRFPFPEIEDADQFITALYTNILNMDEPPNGDGRRNWHEALKQGRSRRDIYDFFIKTARDENMKNDAKTIDFWDLLDRTTGRKRALIVIKESMGDCLMMTQTFESFHKQYPDHDLYVACEPRFRDVFVGNPHVFKVLDYQPAMEQELIMIGAGKEEKDCYFSVYSHPAIPSQRQLSYLSSANVAHTLDA